MVSGFTTRVKAAVIATLALSGIASSAAIAVCMTGMITPTNSPRATARGTERWVIRHRAGWRRWGAKGRSSRKWWTVSRVGIWRVSHFMGIAGSASAIVPKEPLLLPFPIPFLNRLALVVHFLAFRERQFDLCPPPAVEIDRQRDERQALARHRAVKLGDFAVLEQQFPRPPGLVVQAIAMAVFRDVAVDQPNLVALHGGVALGD